jgi:hypothetical protein
VEPAAGEDALAIDFTTRDHVVRKLFALDEQPGKRAPGTVLVEVTSAILGFLEPLLQSPYGSFLL